MEINYKELCLETCRVAKLAAAFIKQEAQHFDISRVEYKDVNNLVSYVDKTAEQMIIEELKKLLPEATFIAEESFNEAQAKFKWIINPTTFRSTWPGIEQPGQKAAHERDAHLLVILINFAHQPIAGKRKRQQTGEHR